jgi:predicted small metal-binding protein
MKNDRGITPNVPGTSPVTDIPQPGNDPYNEPGAPDIQPGGTTGQGRSEETSTSTYRADPNNNPFSGSPTGGIGKVEPSSPTIGTEEWGKHSNEANTTSRPENETRRSGVMANPQDVTHDEDVRFQCSQLHSECKWETSGRSVDELMPRIEQHGREKHGLQSFGQEIREKIQNLIHKHAA